MRSIICLITIILSVQLCFGATINVPTEQPTIQAGIDASSSADTVLVADGTYTGDGNRDIDFGGKNIVLMSENGPDATVIDCEASSSEPHRAFYLHSSEDSTTVVDGFTVMNAYYEEQGAFYIASSSPTIKNCIITANGTYGLRVRENDSNPRIFDCEIHSNAGHGISLSDVLYPVANIEMTNCVLWGNGGCGMLIHSAWNVLITNCTFVYNGQTGLYIEGDPPKGGHDKDRTQQFFNNISAFNSGAGIQRIFTDALLEFVCNDAFGNDQGNWVNVPAYDGDINGNFSMDPLFCNPLNGDFQIHTSSPCSPDNNECGVLVGALGTDCSDIICGDVNGDGMTYTVGDLVHLARYIAGTAPAIAPLENSDVDLCGSVNISDLALYAQFFVYGMSVGICQPTDECYLPTGTNEVSLGCPIEMPIVSTDSFPLPIHVTNDVDLAAFSIGLHYGSDDVEFSSLDMTGSVLSSNWWVLVTTPSDTNYVHSVPDSNMLVLTGYADVPEIEAVPPQEDGLLAILWFDVKPGALAQVLNFEPVFFPPAGEFLFSPIGKGSIVPAYDDCGPNDVILFDYICGDADDSGQVDIDDVIFLIQCIFVDCLGIPMERLDVTCDGELDIDDVVYLVAYIFAGGNAPCDIDGDGMPDC